MYRKKRFGWFSDHSHRRTMSAMGTPYGLQSMLKDGYKHMSGLDEAVLKNIEACKQLSQITRTSFGPNGLNKMVINHLERLFVTSDTTTILTELEVAHPAASMLVLAAKALETEIGDGTNFVVTLAGELLAQAQSLLVDGLHPSEVVEGYSKARDAVLEMLGDMVLEGSEKLDCRDLQQVSDCMRSAVSAKQFGYEDLLCPLIAEACISTCPSNPANFNVDNESVAKITGTGLGSSEVIKGMIA